MGKMGKRGSILLLITLLISSNSYSGTDFDPETIRNIIPAGYAFIAAESFDVSCAAGTETYHDLAKAIKRRAKRHCKFQGFDDFVRYELEMRNVDQFPFGKVYELIGPDERMITMEDYTRSSFGPSSEKFLNKNLNSGNFKEALRSFDERTFPHIVFSQLFCARIKQFSDPKLEIPETESEITSEPPKKKHSLYCKFKRKLKQVFACGQTDINQ